MNIAVYCGASYGKNNAYQEAARKVGKWIAEKKTAWCMAVEKQA